MSVKRSPVPLRSSERLNKGQPPRYLSDFQHGASAESSDISARSSLATSPVSTISNPDTSVRTDSADTLVRTDSLNVDIPMDSSNKPPGGTPTTSGQSSTPEISMETLLKEIQNLRDEANREREHRKQLEATIEELRNTAKTTSSTNNNALDFGQPTPTTSSSSGPPLLNIQTEQQFMSNVGQLNAQFSNMSTESGSRNSLRFGRPKLYDLPAFSGKAEEWPMFVGSFQMTTESYGYNEVENLQRLQKCLTGSARAAVECLLVYPQNVDQVMSTLEIRFGRPEHLVKSQLQKARSIPPIPPNKLDQLVPFATTVQNLVTFLDTPQTQQHLGNPTLMEELVAKLPPSLGMQWMQASAGILPYATLKDLSKWILEQSIYASRLYTTLNDTNTNHTAAANTKNRKVFLHSQSDCNTDNDPDKRQSQQLRDNTTQQPLASHRSSSSSERDQLCEYCANVNNNSGHNHIVAKCPEFAKLSVASRWEFVKTKRLCISCLRLGHGSMHCRRRRLCKISGCSRIHSPLLHENKETSASVNKCPSVPPSAPIVPATPAEGPSSSCHHFQSHRREPDLYFRVVPVKLSGPNGELKTFALLDEGSAVTMVDDDIANYLGLDGKPEVLNLQWFGGKRSSEPSKIVKLHIRGSSPNAKSFELHNVRTVKSLDLPLQTIRFSQLHTRFHHIKDLPMLDYIDAKPKILIGLDNCHLGVPIESLEGLPSDPIAANTKLGWVIYGPNHHKDFIGHASQIVLHASPIDDTVTLDDIHATVRDYFTIENFGVKKPERILESAADHRARQILESSTVRIGAAFQSGLLWKQDSCQLPPSRQMATNRLHGIERKMQRDAEYAHRYVTNIDHYLLKGYARRLSVESGLLWKQDSCQLPPSRQMATNRLHGIERKMQRDAEYAHRYVTNIDHYLLKGYARRLSVEEAGIEPPRTWYLPHFAVQNPNKPGKFRLVFDAAAKVNGTSLNSELLTGPDQYRPLPHILFQFRLGSVGVCGDIREMFHQVRIQPSDLHSQRFLWRGGDTTKPIETFEMIAMTFGATCSPCTAQYVRDKNADEHVHINPVAAKAIKENHYVDDYVMSFSSQEEAISVSLDVKKIHAAGGFELVKFKSNSPAVLRALGGSDREPVSMQLETEISGEKILGMYWNPADDSFSFQFECHRVHPAIMTLERQPTKREALSFIMSVFDPFGFLANFMIYGKLLLQDLWKTGMGWDEPVPADWFAKWSQWISEINVVKTCKIPRCHSPRINCSPDLQLHIFADASESAFAAVAYWRISSPDQLDVSFIAGKTKCAPQKLLSIPRLELQAAVLAARLKASIVSCHKLSITKVVFWSDSKTVINWIQSDHRRYKPFVAHRISEILDESESSSWRWLPTKLNVADDATRASYPPKYDPQCRWLLGPSFLRSAEVEWPTSPAEFDAVEPPEELRNRHVNLVLDGKRNFAMIDFDRFSNFLRLKRTMAWVMRFSNNLLCRVRSCRSIVRGNLSSTDIIAAEKQLCRVAQSESFVSELSDLKRDKFVDRQSTIRELMPYIDTENLIRVGGRIDAASDVSFETKRPVILPKNHPISALIVKYYHYQMAHQNQEAIIAAIRQHYWVPHLRSIVRRVKSNCNFCKFRSVKPQVPVMGPLPEDRLTPFVRPFTYTGLDYFGPVYVAVGRRREKRWVALFTCLTVRAIHLELAADLSTDSCILCIRNFVNLRGTPIRIRSDNGTNFVGANREMKDVVDLFDQGAIQDELSTRGIEWKFNCPANPEAGGSWERMVQSVKKVLAVTLKENTPRVETLRSLLYEAMNIVNSRPLTHVPVEPGKDEPLTPNHFLLGSASSTQTPGPIDNSQLCHRKQFRIAQQMKNQFWWKWILEYLPVLTRRAKWNRHAEPLKVGDLVLICDENQARSVWARGRIVEVFPGSDGRIRTARVQTSTGVLRRPASRLAVLDIN